MCQVSQLRHALPSPPAAALLSWQVQCPGRVDLRVSFFLQVLWSPPFKVSRPGVISYCLTAGIFVVHAAGVWLRVCFSSVGTTGVMNKQLNLRTPSEVLPTCSTHETESISDLRVRADGM
jgi:hypothetical protein